MNVDSVTIRKATPEDARGWETLGIQVWRDAYRHIFPEEVFLEKESRLEEKIARFNDWAYVIGVLKENHKARNVYEAWGGKLSEHEEGFLKRNVSYPVVFYTFLLEKTPKPLGQYTQNLTKGGAPNDSV